MKTAQLFSLLLLVCGMANAAIEFKIDKTTGSWSFSTDSAFNLTFDSPSSVSQWHAAPAGINTATFNWVDGASSGTGSVLFLVTLSGGPVESFELSLDNVNYTSATNAFTVTPTSSFDTNPLTELAGDNTLTAFDPNSNPALETYVVPEPSAWALLSGIAVFGLVILRKRKS